MGSKEDKSKEGGRTERKMLEIFYGGDGAVLFWIVAGSCHIQPCPLWLALRNSGLCCFGMIHSSVLNCLFWPISQASSSLAPDPSGFWPYYSLPQGSETWPHRSDTQHCFPAYALYFPLAVWHRSVISGLCLSCHTFYPVSRPSTLELLQSIPFPPLHFGCLLGKIWMTKARGEPQKNWWGEKVGKKNNKKENTTGKL